MTKYEELIKHIKNKDTSVDAIAKKYKMSVMDVKIMQEWKNKHKVIKNLPEENMVIMKGSPKESWEDKYKKEHKLRQEAEGELSIMKGIETNRVKEAQAKSNQLQNELDRTNKEKNDLYNRIAELIETNEKEIKNLKWIKDHDYIFLIDENKKLHKEVRELKEDNKKLAQEIDDRIARARKAGM